MRVAGEFKCPVFATGIDGNKCLRMWKKLADKGIKSTQESYAQHIVFTQVEYAGMVLTIWYQFNGEEWDNRMELISKFEAGALTEVVNTGEWI
jgi:hypothetical protein